MDEQAINRTHNLFHHSNSASVMAIVIMNSTHEGHRDNEFKQRTESRKTSPACLFIHHIRGLLPIISNKYNSTNYKR
jgi:hypothetical protein